MKNLILIPVLFFSFLIGCSRNENELTDTHLNKRLRDAMISYMSEPMFRNRDFVQQITGTEADLKLYDLDSKMLYFVINRADFDSSNTLNKLTINPNAVEFGFENNGDMFLGEYTLKGNSRLIFRFPKNDFKPDSTQSVKVMLPDSTEYKISMNELSDFADDKSVYGGKTDSEVKTNKYMANHMAFVSNGKEPSLNRFTDKILQNKLKDGKFSFETKAQVLLDFLTANIQYSKVEAYGGYEVLKRPNEVLLTGKSDCSGLVILYASLLEQIGSDYILVYFKDHIAVGIKGSFPNKNGIKITFEGKDYSYAECTVPGFKIGITELLEKDIKEKILYIQKPGKDSPLSNYN